MRKYHAESALMDSIAKILLVDIGGWFQMFQTIQKVLVTWSHLESLGTLDVDRPTRIKHDPRSPDSRGQGGVYL